MQNTESNYTELSETEKSETESIRPLNVRDKYLSCYVNEYRSKFSKDHQKVTDEKDGHKCQVCGSEEYLEVHHRATWAEAPDLRLHPDNGIVLCVDCHAAQHEKLHDLIMSKKAGDSGG